MLWLYIILGVFCFFIVIGIIGFFYVLKLHKNLFGNRYSNDTRINYFKKEEFNLEEEPVEVNMEGITLRGGLFYYSDIKTNNLLVLNHGMWSSIDAYMQDIAYYAKKGFLVIAINHEGVESSDGKNIKCLANSLKCLDYVLRYVKSNPRFKDYNLYVVGHSWGGFATINITSYHNDIKGIFAISPFISVKACMKGLFPKALWPFIPLFLLIEKHYASLYSKANALKGLKDFKGNIVIMHSRNDNIVKFRYNTGMLVKKHINNISYIIVEDRDHNPYYTYESIMATRKFQNDIKGLSNSEKDLFMKNTDFHKLGYLDEELLDKAVKLLLNGEVKDGK